MRTDSNSLPHVITDGCPKIGYGATSTVYLLPDGTACKIFNPQYSFDEIRQESRMAENLRRLGIRVPESFGMVKDGDRIGIRSEFVNGSSLAELLNGQNSCYDRILPEYVRELRHFHETKASSEDFTSAAYTYLEKIDALSGTSWYTPEELKKMERLVRSVPARDTLLQGDYHPKNILVRNGQLCFVDHGDTCIGHPVFDFAMIANTHFIIPSVNPSYARKFFTVDPCIMLRLWDDVFSLYFSGFSQERQNTVRQGIMACAVLRQGLSPADKRVFSERVLMENVAVTKRKLLPNIELITGSIDW